MAINQGMPKKLPDCQQPTAASRKARKDSPPEPGEGVWPYQHFGFGPLTSRTVREEISAVLSHQFVLFVMAALGC